MEPVRKQLLTGYSALSAAAAIWGGMYVVSKAVLDYIPPFTLLWLRYVTGFILLWLLLVRQGLRQPLGVDRKLFVTIGLVGYLVSVGLQFVGTKLSSAHMGAILTSASPAFIVIFARWMLNEALTMRKILSVLAATTGVLIVIGFENGMAHHGGSVLIGNIALLGAAVTWALLSVLARKGSRKYSPLVITTYSIFWAMLMTTPIMVAEWFFMPVSGLDRPLVWLAVLYLGVVSTAGAFYLWNKGMQLVEAGTGSLFFFLQPVVGAFLGWLVLGEKIGASFFIGGLIILLAVLAASLPSRNH